MSTTFTAAPTLELQNKFTELASLFSNSLRDVADKVAKAVNKKEQEVNISQSNSSQSSNTSSSTSEYKAIKEGADILAKKVNEKLEEIENVVNELPGTNKTVQQLLDEIQSAEAKNIQAGELLDVAQEEAKKWLTFVDESNQRLAEKNLERLGDSNMMKRSGESTDSSSSSSSSSKRQKR